MLAIADCSSHSYKYTENDTRELAAVHYLPGPQPHVRATPTKQFERFACYHMGV